MEEIRTWQERTGNHNIRHGSVKHMIAEIAELRAALARAGSAAPTAPSAQQEGAGEVDAKDAVLADARKWIVKNRPAITLSRQATIDEYLYLLKKIDTAIAAHPKDTTDTRRDA